MHEKLPSFQKFSDPSINFKRFGKTGNRFRIYLVPIFLVFIFSSLFVRLFQLTIVRGAYYRYIAENNRILEIALEAPRGSILDRNGLTIAYSDDIKRKYTAPEATAHLVGYRQLASKEDLENDICRRKLVLNDKIGKQGLEKIYECQLRGKKGKRLVEVDAKGNAIRTINLLPPEEGFNIRASIDLRLQKKAYDLLKDKKGSLVASNPQTGEILALVSTPSYNPEAFENNDIDNIKKYFYDKNQPLFDRAVHGTYPPGSVFKPVVAAAALQTNMIDTNFTVEDTGQIKAGEATFGNWYFLQYGKTEGMVNITKALQRSNDIFFYKVGEKLGEGRIRDWAEKFGYGKSSGIKLGDDDGLLPSSFWKKDALKEDWYLGDTYNLSIGQGYMLVTPLQVNLATIPFANNGSYCIPKLLKSNFTAGETDLVLEQDRKPECHSVGISKQVIATVREGMRQACAAGGTGWPFFDFKAKSTIGADANNRIPTLGDDQRVVPTTGEPAGSPLHQKIDVGCKTGTAESHNKDQLPHAWFTVFAPFDNPQIVMTVMVEESGEGSDIAGPIAKDLLKFYFENN